MKKAEKWRLSAGVVLCISCLVCAGETSGQAPADGTKNITNAPKQKTSETSVFTNIPEVVVVSKRLDQSQDQIVPSLGATKYTVTTDQIDVQSQGDNASFDQTMIRFPGVVQDELDKRLHVRGEEANLQYRINDILLPSGLLGYGQELNTKFVDSLSLVTGTLPAQYGDRTAGIVDIRTKSGADVNGGNVSLYGGSYATFNPSFEYGGTTGNLTCYFTGNYLHNDMGLANPTASRIPIHDDSDQYKGFAYFSYVIDDSSRVDLILSGAEGIFQIPNIPGKAISFTNGALTTFNSTTLNENQTEQSYYEVLTWQKQLSDLEFQLSQFTRSSEVQFMPDKTGDLMFNGIASQIDHTLIANGFSGDAKYDLNQSHTLRGGFSFTVEQAAVNTENWVFPVVLGNPLTTPEEIPDDNSKRAYQYSAYLQDEWALTKKLTVNYGLRYDGLNAYLNEDQLSPRVNMVYQVTDDTALHAGYARYFTPPPLYFVSPADIAKYVDTTGYPEIPESSPVKAERYHYFDAGITEQVSHEFHVGLDGYYKLKKDVLDEGQFGNAMIFSPYNGARGRVYGVELTMNYTCHGFSAYENLSLSRAMAEGITSGQFQFDPVELAYLQTHWYHLDHDQGVTSTTGVSYQFGATKVYVDGIYGSGMYGGFANEQEAPGYFTANAGIKHEIMNGPSGKLSVRFDVVNVLDKVYEIRNGDGIGVFAPQYLPRRGFYGGVVYEF